MTKQEEIIKRLFDTIDGATNGFNKTMPSVQRDVFDEITVLLKSLDTDALGNVKQSVNNLKLIARVKLKIGDLILSEKYKKALKKYMATFNVVDLLQNKYFESLAKDYGPPKVLGELRKQSINATLDHLTETGINYKVVNKIGDLLDRNVRSGGKYGAMVEQLRESILTTNTPGALESHVKQITTDALNIYSREYSKSVTDDLGLQWFMYTGAIIDSSRILCQALIKKKYIHVSEIPDIIRGNFKEFKDMDGTISSKTKLPDGMRPETTADNFQILCGGFGCNHTLTPVDETVVPKTIRMETYQRTGNIKKLNELMKPDA